MATKTKSTQTSAEKILHATLYSIGDGVIATDKRGKVTMMNPIAEKLTGWKETVEERNDRTNYSIKNPRNASGTISFIHRQKNIVRLN